LGYSVFEIRYILFWPGRSPTQLQHDTTLEKLYLLRTILDEDDIYMKIVAFDEIYDFCSFEFFLGGH
jgi:hypothetical protein